MATLYVPIIVNDELNKIRANLFAITSKEYSGKKSEFNGREVSEFNAKLKKTFSQAFSFDIYEYGKEKKDGVFKNFSGNTLSISLGVLCSAYATVHNRKLKEKYDSITVTGNFDVDDNGKICLQDVIYLKEKYNAVQNYASANSDKKHLFLYISPEEVIPDGLQENNVLVVRYDGSFPVECVFAEVFEPTDNEKQCIQSLQQYKKDYIETAFFIKWKKELVQNNCNGIILHGASNSGKTLAATNLCKYLIATTTVKEIIWITISDNKDFWDKLHKGLFNCSEIIKEEFSDKFEMLDKLLGENKKCCLIFDNIEGDFTDRILKFVKNNYKGALAKKILKIVITTWKNSEDKSVLQDLQLQEKNCETLMVHTDFKYIVYNAFENMGIVPVNLKNFKENQNKILEFLSDLCFDGGKAFPGRITQSIASILEIGINSFINKYSQDNLKILPKKTRQFRIDFEILDPMSQWVLFAFLGINKFKKEIDIQKICEIINTKIFNRVPESAFVSEQNINDAVEKLCRKEWIQEINSNSKVFYVKVDTIDYCVFSVYEKDEIAKNLGLIRDILIPLDIRIKHAIQNDHFEIFEKLIKDFNSKEKINDLFIRCIECDRGMNYLKILDDKGIDPQYLDEDENSAIDVIWCCQNPDMKTLNYLLEKGFKPRKRIPVPLKERDRLGLGEYISPLLLVSDKGHAHLFKYVLDNHLYDDINDYVFKGLYTVLQFNVECGNSVEIVDLLIKSGADVSLKTNNGDSLLTLAVLNENHPEILEYILKNHFYTDIDEKDKNGRTALHLAYSNTKSLELLLKYGADKNALSNVGATPSHYACVKSKDVKSIELLLKYGANKDVRDYSGRTLLHAAAVNKDSTILKYILEHHYYGDINETDNNGYTALHQACAKRSDVKSIELLINHEANASICTRKGNTILHIAVSRDNKLLVEYILKHLPTVIRNQKNMDGKTPADLAKSDDIKKLFKN